MKAIVGNERQEEIIMSLGMLANQLFPEIGLYPYKGLFRASIKRTLAKTPFTDLKELVEQDVETRKNFFDSMIDESKEMLLDQGLLEKDIDVLTQELTTLFHREVKAEEE